MLWNVDFPFLFLSFFLGRADGLWCRWWWFRFSGGLLRRCYFSWIINWDLIAAGFTVLFQSTVQESCLCFTRWVLHYKCSWDPPLTLKEWIKKIFFQDSSLGFQFRRKQSKSVYIVLPLLHSQLNSRQISPLLRMHISSSFRVRRRFLN